MNYGCNVFVFDNKTELEKFIPYKKVVKLLLRISFPNPDSVADLSKKFGSTPAQAMELLQDAQDLGINVIGLSFHVGS
jgi:ornithine decarboxylase